MVTKEYLISFWLSILISVFLFYRNKNYDRMLAWYIIFLGLSNLVLYGYNSNANNQQCCKWLLILTILQPLFLSLSLYFKTTGKIQTLAGYLLIINMIVFISLLFYINSDNIFNITDNEIYINEKPMGMGLKILYILLVASSLILMNCYFGWNKVNTNLLLVFFFLAVGYFFKNLFIELPRISVIFCLITWSSTLVTNKT